MKRYGLGALLAGGWLAALVACSAGPPADPGSLHLRVVATHDFHGALRPTTYPWSNGRPVGGAAALKTVVDRAEAACACPTVRLDGGDQMQGTLESNLARGESVVAAFNLLELDAAAVGNHELDWGVETLLLRQSEADYAWLAANVFRADTGERPEWATPFTIIERDEVKVAVIGYLTVNTPRTLRPDVTRPYEFRGGYQGIRDALDAARRTEPDFTILVAHAGGDCQGDTCMGEMVELAAELPPDTVHLIVGGHTHAPGEGVVNAIPIVRPGAHGRAVAVVDLIRLADGTRTFQVARDIVYADAVEPDAAMAALLAPYMVQADAIGGMPVTTLGETLSSEDRRLGDLVADAERLVAQADFAMHNPGGLRADLLAGKVSYGDLYRVLPFGNIVVRLTLSGRQLRQVVEQAGRSYYFSNLQVAYDPNAPPGSRVVSLTFADGRPVLEDRTYTLATIDFLADGGGDFTMLQPLARQSFGVTDLDALATLLRDLPAPVVVAEKRPTFAIRGE